MTRFEPATRLDDQMTLRTELEAAHPGYDLQDLVAGRVLQAQGAGQQTAQATAGRGRVHTCNRGTNIFNTFTNIFSSYQHAQFPCNKDQLQLMNLNEVLLCVDVQCYTLQHHYVLEQRETWDIWYINDPFH